MPQIEYQYGDVDQHAATLRAQAGAMEGLYHQIRSDVDACADFWGGVGSSGYADFVTELNRNFAVVFEALNDHGAKITNVRGQVEDADNAVGKSWMV